MSESKEHQEAKTLTGEKTAAPLDTEEEARNEEDLKSEEETTEEKDNNEKLVVAYVPTYPPR